MKEANPKFNRSIPLALLLFSLLALLPTLAYPWADLYQFLNVPLVSGYYSLSVTVVFAIYAIIVFAKNHANPPLRYFLLFVWILLYTLALGFLHDRQVSSSGSSFTLSIDSIFLYETKMAEDIFAGFAILFIWPFAKKEPRYKNVLLVGVLLVAIASVVVAFIRGPNLAYPFPYYESLFATNEDFGKVLFVGVFVAVILAYDHTGIFRYGFLTMAIALIVFTGFFGLGISFWVEIIAALFVLFYLETSWDDTSAYKSWIRYVIIALILALFALILLLIIPSPAANFLRGYLGDEVAEVWANRLSLWHHYLNSLSSYRIFIGDGAMGYYRASFLLTGQPSLVLLHNGPLELYNAGGVVYLLFYLIVMVVGYASFSKNQSRDKTFYGIVFGFTCAFLINTVFTNERLLLSSNFASLVVAYLLMAYPSKKDASAE